jgi:hypothetical protein
VQQILKPKEYIESGKNENKKLSKLLSVAENKVEGP